MSWGLRLVERFKSLFSVTDEIIFALAFISEKGIIIYSKRSCYHVSCQKTACKTKKKSVK